MSCLDKRLKIYLCGKMSGLSMKDMSIWRKELKQKLLVQSMLSGYDVTVINPVDFYNFETTKHQSENEVREYDIAHTITSDIVIVNLNGLSK